MKQHYKILLIFILIFISGISFYVGGIVGFTQGWFYATGSNAPSDAFVVADIMKRIDRGDIKSAIGMLKLTLDMKIMEYEIVKKQGVSIFDTSNITGEGLCFSQSAQFLMSKAVEYRDQIKQKKETR